MSIKHLVIPLCVAVCSASPAAVRTAAAETTVEHLQAAEGHARGSKPVTIAFSAPGADHGWMAAITDNARKQAKELDGVELKLAEGVTDSAAQAAQVETLIVPSPMRSCAAQRGRSTDSRGAEGDACRRAGRQRGPRIPKPGAYRGWIGGDNYGIGKTAGKYFAEQLECRATSSRSRASQASR